MSIEERDIEEQFFKSIQFNYGKPTTKETIMNFADLIRTDQRNKDAENLKEWEEQGSNWINIDEAVELILEENE